MQTVFKNRRQAGILLSKKIDSASMDPTRTILLGLPRGGVELAYEMSKFLKIPMDVLIVRKVGHPMYSEYGIGAVGEGGFSWLDPDALGIHDIMPEKIYSLFEAERKEVARRKVIYRSEGELPSLEGKTVIIVDDGLATGVTARLAARLVKMKKAKKVVLAVPVCLGKTEFLKKEFDEVVCLLESKNGTSVGSFFRHFDQVSDDEVIALLSEAKNNYPENLIPDSNIDIYSKDRMHA